MIDAVELKSFCKNFKPAERYYRRHFFEFRWGRIYTNVVSLLQSNTCQRLMSNTSSRTITEVKYLGLNQFSVGECWVLGSGVCCCRVSLVSMVGPEDSDFVEIEECEKKVQELVSSFLFISIIPTQTWADEKATWPLNDLYIHRFMQPLNFSSGDNAVA